MKQVEGIPELNVLHAGSFPSCLDVPTVKCGRDVTLAFAFLTDIPRAEV